MNLTVSLCDACPSSEVDEMSIALLNIFDSRSLGFVLVEALMNHEVSQTGMVHRYGFGDVPLTLCQKMNQNC